MKEARDELSRIRHETSKGTYVKPSDETLDQYLREYLEGATRGLRRSTARSYYIALQRARDVLGHRPLQSISKADVERLVAHMLTAGRKRGGRSGSGLSERSAQFTLGRLSAALDMAVREGKLARNPAILVKPPRPTRRRGSTWNQDEVRRFLNDVAESRLHAAWRLTLYGLRRGEVVGLRWSDIDLTNHKMTVSQARIVVDKRIVVEEPKSENGKRTLPLDDELVAALKQLRKTQMAERLEAGTAYEIGLDELDWYTPGDRYLVVDKLGIPVNPNWYSSEFHRIRERVSLPKIRLHDSRHTTLSLMEKAGVPISVISKWAGHHDAAFTMRTYVHASADDLEAGAEKLAELYRPTSA